MNPPNGPGQFLVRSKLERPALPRGLLPREGAGEQLARSIDGRVTLVSAPAGYGKSTMVAQFLEGGDSPPGAWLSLESLDNDLSRFLRYFIEALREVVPDCLPRTERLLLLPNLPPPQYLAESTVAELESLGQRAVLVLDDYHLIRHLDVHEWLEAVVSKLPLTLHLVVIGRSDPPLPLSLWRSRLWLGELRVDDFRFSLQETADFFGATREHDLGDEHIATLHRKTEGWITGLRLFLLSLNGSGRTEERVEAFSASDGQITDYLLEEVLSGQPQEIKDYLAVTSLLERFSPRLTDELLSSSHPSLAGKSQEIVDRLFRMNLFLVPLGSVTGWYRYHHLFRDLLRERLERSAPRFRKDDILDSAGEWFQREGRIEDALRCFLEADDLDAAAEIVGNQLHNVMAEDPSRRTLRRWLEMFPAGAERSRVPLLVAWTYCRSIRSDYVGAGDLLGQIGVICGDAGDGGQEKWCTVFQDDLDYLQCYASLWGGDVEKAYEHGRRLSHPARKPHAGIQAFWPGYYAASLALTGRRAEFLQFVEEGAAGPGVSGLERQWPYLNAKAFVQLCWGDLDRCAETAGRLLADESFPARMNCQELGHLTLGIAAYERNRLDEAGKHFETAVSFLFEGPGFAYWDAMVGLVWIDLACGRIESARRHAAMAHAFAEETNNPLRASESTAIERRIAIATGEPTDTACPRPGAPDFALFSIIPPSQNWAWLQLQSPSRQQRNEALGFIDSALAQAEAHGVVRRTIQLHTLRALALDALDRRKEAVSALQTALQQGADRGFVRSFLDAGEGIRPLLHAVVERRDEEGSAAMLLDVLDAQGRPPAPRDEGTAAGRGVESPAVQLTKRETEVLRMLQRRWPNKEIAARLGISVATAKRHTLNIYAKLGVHGRRQAVAAAIERGLLHR